MSGRQREAAQDHTDLAEDRTGYAEDRTVLANERTYSAWLRTGLAALAVGIGAARLLGEAVPGWAVNVMATTLIVLGVIIFAVALWRYTHLGRRLRRSEVSATPTALVVGMSALAHRRLRRGAARRLARLTPPPLRGPTGRPGRRFERRASPADRLETIDAAAAPISGLQFGSRPSLSRRSKFEAVLVSRGKIDLADNNAIFLL